MRQRRKFSATGESRAVRYYIVGLAEPSMLEDLRLSEGLEPEAVAEIRRDARDTGSTVAVLGFLEGRGISAVLPNDVSCAVAFRSIAEKFGTRFDAEKVVLSPGLVTSLDAIIQARFHTAPETVQ